jgi:hypothetical protein
MRKPYVLCFDDAPAPSPELEVDELSQICEGLARQRPEICQTLLNALALIAPCSMPFLMWCFYQRRAGALSAGEPDAGPPLRV